mmetsp:Transcript_22081/g.39162  ORF Transcript_22081/g.39162 Transcript_22081/m.39162 type:complete len:224 (-) Transcript_22081:818-1489(-)
MGSHARGLWLGALCPWLRWLLLLLWLLWLWQHRPGRCWRGLLLLRWSWQCACCRRWQCRLLHHRLLQTRLLPRWLRQHRLLMHELLHPRLRQHRLLPHWLLHPWLWDKWLLHPWLLQPWLLKTRPCKHWLLQPWLWHHWRRQRLPESLSLAASCDPRLRLEAHPPPLRLALGLCLSEGRSRCLQPPLLLSTTIFILLLALAFSLICRPLLRSLLLGKHVFKSC